MRCQLCNSNRILKFIDGFGERRVFCRGCGRSFLENNFVKFKNQTNLLEFNPESHFRQFTPNIR